MKNNEQKLLEIAKKACTEVRNSVGPDLEEIRGVI